MSATIQAGQRLESDSYSLGWNLTMALFFRNLTSCHSLNRTLKNKVRDELDVCGDDTSILAALLSATVDGGRRRRI